MNLSEDVRAFNENLGDSERQIAVQLCSLIFESMPNAEGKVWHGSPVWFLEGNPIVGYSHRKTGIELLFWSGQSFASPGLRPMGKFKAAALSIPTLEQLNSELITACLVEAKVIQWDYQNLPKRKVLVKLGDF